MDSRKLAFCLLAATTLLFSCSSRRPVQVVTQAGDRAYLFQNYATAAVEYQEVVDRYPGEWYALYRLGLCQLEMGQLIEANRSLHAAWTMDPENDDVADARAEALFKLGRNNELYTFLRDRAEMLPSARAYLRIARYAIELQDPDSARTALVTAIVVDQGQTVEPYLEAAAFAESLGRMDEAVRRVRQAYGVNPRDQRVLAKAKAYGETPGPTFALPHGR